MENDKQPASAVSREMCEISEINTYPYGLTKREYFASQAMVGYCSSGFGMPHDSISLWCVKMADALLSELDK